MWLGNDTQGVGDSFWLERPGGPAHIPEKEKRWLEGGERKKRSVLSGKEPIG